MDETDYADMVEHTPVDSYVVEYREQDANGLPGRLVGACLTDQQGDGLSMIYSFFETDSDARPGLGNYIIIDHILRAQQAAALCLSRLLGRRVGADAVQDPLSSA